MRLAPARAAAFLTAAAAVAAAARADPPAVTPDDLLRAGRAAQARLLKTGARWVGTVTSATGTMALVGEWTVSPAGSRCVVSIRQGGRRTPLATVVERAGVWYVTDGPRRVKCQPFAYPFDVPMVTSVYWMTQLRTADRLRPGGSVDPASDGDRVVYRTPLDPAAAGAIDRLLAQYDAMAKSDPAGAAALDADVKANLARLRDVRAHGVGSTIDAKAGVMVRTTLPQDRTLTIDDFRWLADGEPVDLATPGPWDDRTAGPTAVADPGQLAMANVDGVGSADRMGSDTDARVVDLSTGDNWRVPFRGVGSAAGAFLPDRRTVVVAGYDFDNGGLRLYAIDLRSGQNTPLGGGAIAAGNTLFPEVSPDGRTVAALHADPAYPRLQARVALVDVRRNHADLIGPVATYGSASWLPDGSGLILFRHDATPDAERPAETLVRMTLDGRVTDLRPGAFPVVLPGQNRILFKDGHPGDDRRPWATCDLTGGDVRPFGDGLAEYIQPTVSPDGKRLLMCRLTGPDHPELTSVLFDPADPTASPKPVKLPGGLWTHPHW